MQIKANLGRDDAFTSKIRATNARQRNRKRWMHSMKSTSEPKRADPSTRTSQTSQLNTPNQESERATMSIDTQAQPAIADPWELVVPAAGGGDFEPCPPGTHVGTIVAMFDVGTHDEEYKGVSKTPRKMVIVFELQKTKKDGTHFMLSKCYTMSMGDKANWFKLVTSLLARRFSEGEKFNPKSMVGMPCMILVTNETVTAGDKEKTYTKIENVMMFPEGFPIPTNYRPPVLWSVHVPEPLPDVSWVPHIYGQPLDKLIRESHEFKAGKVVLPTMPASAAEAPKGQNGAAY